MEDILAILLIFGGGTLFALSISPVGRAIADRIRGGRAALPDQALDELRDSQMALADDIDTVRQELVELGERLDFAERLLAARRGMGALPGGEGSDAAAGGVNN